MLADQVGTEEVPVAESDTEDSVVTSASPQAEGDATATLVVEDEVVEAVEEAGPEVTEPEEVPVAESDVEDTVAAPAPPEVEGDATATLAVEDEAEEVTEEAEDAAEEAEEVTDEAEDAAEEAEEVAEETEDAAEEAEEAEPQDNRLWYVVHCYSGYENKVKHNLEQRIDTMQMEGQIFQVVVPTEDEMEVRDGKRRVIERRVFPGYILVQMILTDDSWFVVRNTPGVTGFVGMGNEPTPLRTEEVNAIMKRMEAEAPKIKVTFKSGQKVRIIDGPFNEFIGVVDEIDMERAKVRVLVSFFGRETPVELDFLQVEKT
jgi:transcriptional antiterminator NusG